MKSLLAGLLALVLAGPTLARDAASTDAATTLGDLTISAPFARATLPGQPVGGGFMTITNAGAADDTLVAAHAEIAGMVQIHEMKMVGEVMQMRELEEGLVIPAGGAVELSPGGTHIMFMDMHGGFVAGQSVPVTLVFEHAGEVTVDLPVGAPNADAAPGMMDHGDMNHGDMNHGAEDGAMTMGGN